MTPILAQAWPTNVQALAAELVRAASTGDQRADDLSLELAEAVGETLEPVNQLVAAVAAGGPFTVRRALDLVVAMSRRTAAGTRPLRQEEAEEGAGEA